HSFQYDFLLRSCIFFLCDPSALTRDLPSFPTRRSSDLNGQPVTIIGVAPESFHGLNALLDTQGYLPVGMAAVLGDASNDFLTAREPRFTLVARLKPDANLRQADSAMQVVSQRLTLQNAKADAWLTLRA